MALIGPPKARQTRFFDDQDSSNSTLGLSGRTLSGTICRMFREGFSRKPDTPCWKRLAALASEFGITGLRKIILFADFGVAPAEPPIVGLGRTALLTDV